MAFGVPVKVTVAVPPGQTVVLLATLTVGVGITVIVTVPLSGAVQFGVPEEEILISVNTVVTEKLFVTEAVPDASSAMVCVPPGLAV